ncbi:MAG: GNAT family N-acetyltransferase [Roseococcus sp.]|nr:GNAT family N-acetyltransferase [Roseococcus sp.]
MNITIETVTGAALLPHVPALSRLRAEVFAEWPYLYDAEPVEEAKYMAHYAEDPRAAIVLAKQGEEVVGAASAQPMETTHPEVRTAFLEAGLDPAEWCYFGESVLRAPWRGQGIGVRFFAAREAHARALGFTKACFCAVIRNANDPRKPPGYVPLDGFWRRRGYLHQPSLTCLFRWREHGDSVETPHLLSFWTKHLA